MKLYGMKMHNFMRFGELGNSIVFNVTEEQKRKIQNNELTFDELYQSLSSDPLNYIEKVNNIKGDNVLEGIIGISGMTSGSFDNSNGSGKSTIFEAIAFLFYDRIVRQTANNDKKASAGLSVVTKLSGKYPENLKESFVEAYFEEDSRIYRVKRGRSFTKTKNSSTPVFEFDCIKDNEVDSLSGHRKKDTKRSLEEVIVEDYDIFVNTVMFGQNDAGKFLTGTDKTKKDMIIELLKLEDVVHGCIDIVRSHKKEESDELNGFIFKASSFKGLVISAYKEFSDESTEEKVDYSTELIDVITNLINERIKDCKKDKKGTEVTIDNITKEIKKLEDSDIIKEIKKLTEEGQQLVKDKSEREQKKTSDIKDWKGILLESKNNLSSCNTKVLESTKELNKHKEDLEKCEKSINSFNENDYKEKIEKCQRAESAKEKYKDVLTDVNDQRESTILKVSEFDAFINIKRKDLLSLNAQVKNAGDSDKFVCSECQSIVSKEHTLKKINDIEEIIKTNTLNRDKVKEKLSKLNEAKDSVSKKIEKIAEYKLEHQRLVNEKQSIENTRDNLKNKKNFIDQYESDISEKKLASETLVKKIEEYQNKCDNIEKEYKKDENVILASIEDKKVKIRELKESSNKIESKIREYNEAKINLVSVIADLDKKGGSLQEKLNQIIDLGKQISNEEKKIELSNRKLQRLKILESAFGLEGVQTRIVAKYLPLLNMYVKQFLDILSGGKLIIDMFINDKSKVDMAIIGGTSDDYVMLSGGEKMIVRLAVDVGLSLLSFSRTSKTPDMICLDEIFGPLDLEHTKSVFLMLDKLKDKFKRVYIISHKLEIQSLVKNNIIVEKSSGNRGLSKIIGISDI